MELNVTAQIMRHWFGPHPAGVKPPLWDSYPEDYLIFDTETTGREFPIDLVVEYGWHLTRGRKMASNDSILINWVGHYGITYDWLKQRMDNVRNAMAAKGAHYRFTPELLMEQGIPAPQAVEQIYGFFSEALDRGELLLGHNIISYDRPMLDAMFARFHGGRHIPWPHNAMFDTGLVEKASQQNRVPRNGDTLYEWAGRVAKPPYNVKWALDRVCIPKYKLDARYGLDPELAHTAAFDCRVVDGLFDTYRQIGEGTFVP